MKLLSGKIKLILISVSTLLTCSFAIYKEKPISDFKLKNTNGQYISLKDYPDAKGFMIVFTCNHCPFAKLYPPRLNELSDKYKFSVVPLIAISSTDTNLYEEDTYSKMIEKAKKEHFKFPYLFDGEQAVAKNFKAQKTPHAFLIWKENNDWVIKYSGAIDDNGMDPEKVQKHYMADAVEAMLNDREVDIKETKSIGCQIMLRK